ncbi:hypothetical protein H2200_004842 [Cladophialophora chaetospira]|uniref:Oxidoreductase-like protein n=1 Tax=Cladophialophora chaetospira TaxID=386627 RepID=A0AA39CKJ3_9EURO|nr:hypothetical protein H2200_004842 [Cladophialophora chaetospira]
MNAPVEAQSISSLSNLLANPPRYPRNPTHQVHPPLVLYIVRVPGSKDVFLTTLKPPTKASISIEAVQSSLYFLHVERPEDVVLRETWEATKATENHSSPVSSIHRKPLPATPFANYPASQRPPTPPKSYPNFQPPLPGAESSTQAQRFAARGANLRLNTGDPSKPSTNGRRPVGARPLPAGSNLNMPSSIGHDDSSASPSPIDQAQRQFRLAGKPVQPVSPAHAPERGAGVVAADADQHSPTHDTTHPIAQLGNLRVDENATSRHQPESLRITLIRRDPASGSQWNVGTITPQSAIGPLQDIDIDLSSPGYTTFAKLDANPGDGFRRKVAYLQTSKEERSAVTRGRSNSAESFSNVPYLNGKRSRQAYGFLSPWQGVCAFSNGIDGKSLRCRQALPGANPSMPGVTADVAELRFNLPWTTNRLKDPHKKQGNELSDISPNKQVARPDISSNREQWRRSFQVLTHKARKQLSISESNGDWKSPNYDSPSQSADEHRMSLDLGREKAGGGFTGQSAKLGKLIIHDEGLKMCDLVVAACMGVWWQHYTGDT